MYLILKPPNDHFIFIMSWHLKLKEGVPFFFKYIAQCVIFCPAVLFFSSCSPITDPKLDLFSGATYPVCINVIYLNIHSIQSSQTVTILSYSGQMHASYIAPLPTPKKRIMCTDGLLCLF